MDEKKLLLDVIEFKNSLPRYFDSRARVALAVLDKLDSIELFLKAQDNG